MHLFCIHCCSANVCTVNAEWHAGLVHINYCNLGIFFVASATFYRLSASQITS